MSDGITTGTIDQQRVRDLAHVRDLVTRSDPQVADLTDDDIEAALQWFLGSGVDDGPVVDKLEAELGRRLVARQRNEHRARGEQVAGEYRAAREAAKAAHVRDERRPQGEGLMPCVVLKAVTFSKADGSTIELGPGSFVDLVDIQLPRGRAGQLIAQGVIRVDPSATDQATIRGRVDDHDSARGVIASQYAGMSAPIPTTVEKRRAADRERKQRQRARAAQAESEQ